MNKTIHMLVFTNQDTISTACNKKSVCVPRHPQPNVHIQNRILSMDNEGKGNSYDIRIVTCLRCLKRIGSVPQKTLRIRKQPLVMPRWMKPPSLV